MYLAAAWDLVPTEPCQFHSDVIARRSAAGPIFFSSSLSACCQGECPGDRSKQKPQLRLVTTAADFARALPSTRDCANGSVVLQWTRYLVKQTPGTIYARGLHPQSRHPGTVLDYAAVWERFCEVPHTHCIPRRPILTVILVDYGGMQAKNHPARLPPAYRAILILLWHRTFPSCMQP
jgi:hypothetical protein